MTQTETAAALRDAQAGFAQLVEGLRPELHRYCSRMVGSVLDGEDLVQETLAQGFYGLSLLRAEVPLRPWLFQIAHHKCVDFLRRRRRAAEAEAIDEASEASMPIEAELETHQLASEAFSRLVLLLPPRERASVILKEVLGYSLAEVAEIVGTSVGGVKAALHRGRGKLAALGNEAPATREPLPPETQNYIETFNRRDWTALGALLEEEVQCELVGFVHRVGREALQKNYLANYAKLPFHWRLATGTVDGEPAIVCVRQEGDRWVPRHAVRIEWRDGRVARIRDYADVPYLFREGAIVLDP